MVNASPRCAAPLIVAGTALALALAGCSASSSPAPTPTVAPTVKTTPLPADPSFTGKAVGAAADVKITNCGTATGKQTATGTVTNSTKAARDYAIIVIWLRNGDGKPYGSALATVKRAKPGVATNWSVTTNVATAVDKCITNVRAGSLGK